MSDTATLNRKLYNLADAQRTEHGSRMSWYHKIEAAQLGQELYALALEATDSDSLDEAEILPVFFTEEACSLLFRLPNLFWFWRIVNAATLHADDLGPISLESVRKAMIETRNHAARTYNLSAPLESLSPAELVSRAANGIILTTGGLPEERKIVVNIIFTKDY